MDEIQVERILKDSLELNRLYLENKIDRTYTKEQFKNNMAPKYKFLVDNYDAIFKIACGDNYNHIRLKYMLRIASKVQKGDMEEKDASVAVGQILVDEIVKPQLDAAGITPNKKN